VAIADHFVDTYCVEENPRRCFLQITAISKYPHMRADPKKYVFQENAKHDKIFDYEGFIPSIQIRHRFIHALKKCGENTPRLFMMLNQVFKEEAIKVFFPEVWTPWHNVMARKANTTARNEANRLRKLTPRADRVLHNQCAHLTQGMSMRDAARSSRIYT